MSRRTQRWTLFCWNANKQEMGPIKHRHFRYFKTSVISLPKHCGVSALHKPRELHSMLTVPFSAKPLSQVAVHRDPKVKGPFGWEQDRKPRGRSTGLHFFTLGNRKATESSVRHQLRIYNLLPDIFKTLGMNQNSDRLFFPCVRLPWQTGSSGLHWPWDKHLVILVPIKSKPFSHWIAHVEP